MNRFSWADRTFSEVQEPYRIVERGRGGKYNRIRMLGTYTLSPGPGDTTKVEYTFETEPPLFSDRLLEALGAPPAPAGRPLARCAACGRSSRRTGTGAGAPPSPPVN